MATCSPLSDGTVMLYQSYRSHESDIQPWAVWLVELMVIDPDGELPLPPASVPAPASFWDGDASGNIQICRVYCPEPEYQSTSTYTVVPPTDVPLVEADSTWLVV